MDQRAPSVVMATARATGPHLTVAGDLDADGAARLRALLDDAIAPGVRLTLDLSRVTYVSAAALEDETNRPLRRAPASIVTASWPGILRATAADVVLRTV